KWALFDLQVDLEAHAREERTLVVGGEPACWQPRGISTRETEDGFTVDTGAARFTVGRISLSPGWAASVTGWNSIDGKRSRCRLVDGSGREYSTYVKQVSIERGGALRTTFRIEGEFSDGASRFCDFIARVSFFSGSATTRLALTVRNPCRARHRKNLWD